MDREHLNLVGGFLASPVAGYGAAYLFREENCLSTGESLLSASELCTSSPNETVGFVVTGIGWLLLFLYWSISD